MNDCPGFEELNGLVDGDLSAERELGVRRHLDLCVTCTRTIDAITALKQAVGRAYEAETPPPALRRAVIAHRRQHSDRWHWWAIAALLLGSIGMQVFRGDHSPALSTVSTMLVADHKHALLEPGTLEAAIEDPDGLSGWFQDRLRYPVTVRALPDSRLLGGRQLTIFGHALAVAAYERSGDRISVFMTNGAAAAADHPIRQSFNAVGRRRCRNVDEYRVCLHREGEMLVGIVAPERAGPEDLLPVAASF